MRLRWQVRETGRTYAAGGGLKGATARVAKAHLRKEVGGALSRIVLVASFGSSGPSSDDD
jgi:hypothetical protein